MPTTLVLRFPWGRYHATPWGRHVNEGAVELPPSPWRLLRALYATWRSRLPELDEDRVHALLERLAVPPTFFLPPHVMSHTRHYYPDSTHTTIRHSVDRTLDAFAVIEHDAELAVQWPFELPPDQHTLFAALAEALPYFGRADSLCYGTLAPSWSGEQHAVWAPVDVADSISSRHPVTSVLAPELPLGIESLLARPVDVRRGGLLFPSGARLVGYQLVRRTANGPTVPPRRTSPAPDAVRVSILQAALPPATDALVYTDLLRRAALSHLGTLRDEPDQTQLGGKNAHCRALTGQHRHAHYLPIVTEGRLTDIVVWTPDGLPDDELAALTSLTRLCSKINESWRAEVRVAAIGAVPQVAPDLVGRAAVWTSATPYTPARFPKRHADRSTFLREDVIRELGYRDLPPPARMDVVDRGWQEWRRYRPSAGRSSPQGRASNTSAFLQLHFDEPVAGPLVLGHLSHFGLGLFVPES